MLLKCVFGQIKCPAHSALYPRGAHTPLFLLACDDVGLPGTIYNQRDTRYQISFSANRGFYCEGDRAPRVTVPPRAYSFTEFGNLALRGWNLFWGQLSIIGFARNYAQRFRAVPSLRRWFICAIQSNTVTSQSKRKLSIWESAQLSFIQHIIFYVWFPHYLNWPSSFHFILICP